jgi:hypothetical protein
MPPRRSKTSPRGDSPVRKAILEARDVVNDLVSRDVNEAETRHHLVRIFDRVLGFDPYKHLSMEYAVHGVGDADHVDLAVMLDSGPRAKPVMLVELKRVGSRLSHLHIKQADSYAVRLGCEWIILTNGREWMLYHVEFGQPPQSKLAERWNLLEDELDVLADRFRLISLASLRKDGLGAYWRKRRVLEPGNILDAIFARGTLNALRRELRKSTEVLLPVEDIMAGLRRMLNEGALASMEKVEITFPVGEEAPGIGHASAPRSGVHGASVTPAMLIQAGIIKAPAQIFAVYKGKHITATLTAGGEIELAGKRYDSVSTAGNAAKISVSGGEPSTNGWEFWRGRSPDGTEYRLIELRSRFMGED